MNKIIILLLFPVLVFAQNIKGKVINSNSEPIEGASVYLDGTTIGTTTDVNGFFEITASNKYNTLLIVRFLGYEDIIISNPYDKDFHTFILLPKTNEIETVLIVKDGFTRKQKMQLFKEQFLGVTKYGKACKILNEDAIDFNYDLKTFVFTASCSEPIKIENPLLGYLIEFDLRNFYVQFNFKTIRSVNAIQSLFLGTVRYSDVSSDEKIIKNRNDVYFGSSMHFYKTITDNSWSSKGFVLFKGGYSVNADEYFKIVKSNDLFEVTVTPTIKQTANLKYKNTETIYADFNLLYSKKRQSRVIFKTLNFYVDNFGNNSHRHLIVFGGDIGEQKAGNTLPLNFEPEIIEK